MSSAHIHSDFTARFWASVRRTDDTLRKSLGPVGGAAVTGLSWAAIGLALGSVPGGIIGGLLGAATGWYCIGNVSHQPNEAS